MLPEPVLQDHLPLISLELVCSAKKGNLTALGFLEGVLYRRQRHPNLSFPANLPASAVYHQAVQPANRGRLHYALASAVGIHKGDVLALLIGIVLVEERESIFSNKLGLCRRGRRIGLFHGCILSRTGLAVKRFLAILFLPGLGPKYRAFPFAIFMGTGSQGLVVVGQFEGSVKGARSRAKVGPAKTPEDNMRHSL